MRAWCRCEPRMSGTGAFSSGRVAPGRLSMNVDRTAGLYGIFVVAFARLQQQIVDAVVAVGRAGAASRAVEGRDSSRIPFGRLLGRMRRRLRARAPAHVPHLPFVRLLRRFGPRLGRRAPVDVSRMPFGRLLERWSEELDELRSRDPKDPDLPELLDDVETIKDLSSRRNERVHAQVRLVPRNEGGAELQLYNRDGTTPLEMADAELEKWIQLAIKCSDRIGEWLLASERYAELDKELLEILNAGDSGGETEIGAGEGADGG